MTTGARLGARTHESRTPRRLAKRSTGLFADFDRRYPGLPFRVVDEQRRLRPNMCVVVNCISVRDLRHALLTGDFVAVVGR